MHSFLSFSLARPRAAGLVALTALAFNVQAGVVYDVVDDFSTTVNTATSTWSYRASADLVRDGVYDLLTAFSSTGIWAPDTAYWRSSAGGDVPGVGVNDTGGPITFVGNPNTFYWPDDTLWMHPTPGAYVVVSWLAPASGLYDIAFNFTDIDPKGGDGIGWFVDLGDSSGNLGSGILPSGGSSGSLSVPGQFVAAGDRIHFIVSPPAGNHLHDSTALTATITAGPEPSELLAALTAGSLGLLLLRRRRGRSANG